MHRIILFLLVLCINAQSAAHAQDIPEDMIEQMFGVFCNNPKNNDRFGIRLPTSEEVYEHGQGILVFEYWNSLAKCSDEIYMGIYFEDQRFMMEVIVGISMEDPREQIKLQTIENPYYLPIDTLILEDGEEPGTLILYPLIM